MDLLKNYNVLRIVTRRVYQVGNLSPLLSIFLKFLNQLDELQGGLKTKTPKIIKILRV